MDSSGCTRITSSFGLSTPIIAFVGSRLKRTRSSHTRSSIPLPAVKRKGTPRQRGVSTCQGKVQPADYNSPPQPLTQPVQQVRLTCSTSEAKVGHRDPAGTVSSSR